MAISLSRMQDLLGSNGRILMQMVLVFYPLVTLPYMGRTILLFNWVTEKVNHQMECLQSWIVVVISKVQKALMLYWQSTIRPLLDPIMEKMRKVQKALMLYWQSTIRPLLDRIMEKMSHVWEALKMYLQWKIGAIWDLIVKMMNNLSEALKNYLTNDAAMGHPMVKLMGTLALLLAKGLFHGSELQLKYDKSELIAMHFFFICLLLLQFPEYCGEKLKILCRRWGCTANSTSDFIWFLLALLFETYYDNSLENLGVAFSLTILSLSLLVLLRPLTDFGFFSFIIGVVGSITHSRFGLKFPTWLVACICFLIFCLKGWLEKHWSDFEEALPVRPILSTRRVCMIVAGLHHSWTSAGFLGQYFNSQQHFTEVYYSCLITGSSLTDIESSGFTLVVLGFITHDRFGLKFPNWIVPCVCLLTFRLRSRLATRGSDLEEAVSVRLILSTRGIRMFVSYLGHVSIYYWLRFDHIGWELELHKRISVITPLVFFLINFRPSIRTETPMDDQLLPYTRFPLRTQAAYYRSLIYSLAFDFLWWGYRKL